MCKGNYNITTQSKENYTYLHKLLIRNETTQSALSVSHAPPPLPLSHTHILSLSLSHTHTHTHTLFLSNPHTCMLYLCFTHMLTHTHTHARTHAHTHTHTYLMRIECSSFRSSQLSHCCFLHITNTNKNPPSFTFNIAAAL